MHAVEAEHTGMEDSSVLYIPAVPLTLHKWDARLSRLSYAQLMTAVARRTFATNGRRSSVVCLRRESCI